MNKENLISEDEIDLKELFKTIWSYKVFIVIFVAVITNSSIIYVINKNPIPIYQGKIYMEIGQIQNKNFAPVPLENINNLAYILKLEYGVEATIPKNQTKILEIVCNSEDKNIINEVLEKVKDYILEKHKEQISFYESIIPTRQIKDIDISEEPINKPKKKLIVVISCIISFILSIFLILIFDFIKKQKMEF